MIPMKLNKLVLFNLALTGLLLAGWIGFEIFNARTTHDALVYILNDAGYAGPLTMAFVLVDIAALARIVTQQTGSDEPLLVKLLFVAWMVIAGVNVLFTDWVIALQIESHAVSVPSSMAGVVPAMSHILAVVVFAIRVVFMYSGSTWIDHKLNGRKAKPAYSVTKEPSRASGPVRYAQTHQAVRQSGYVPFDNEEDE